MDKMVPVPKKEAVDSKFGGNGPRNDIMGFNLLECFEHAGDAAVDLLSLHRFLVQRQTSSRRNGAASWTRMMAIRSGPIAGDDFDGCHLLVTGVRHRKRKLEFSLKAIE